MSSVATIRNTPGFYSKLEDGGLQPKQPTVDLNQQVLVFGTAENGPMYQPVSVDETNIMTLFGDPDKGTLVKGCSEAMQGSLEGTPNVVGVRIGGAYGQKPSLDLTNSDNKTALRLEGLYPTDLLNGLSIWTEPGGYIKIYNTISGNERTFTYDVTEPRSQSVDARSLTELALAINTDVELREIIKAVVYLQQAHFELDLSSADQDDVVNEATVDGVDYITGFSLKDVLADDSAPTPDASNMIDGSDKQFDSADCGMNIHEVEALYAFDYSGLQQFPQLKSRDRVTLPYRPHNAQFVAGTPDFKTLRTVKAYAGVSDFSGNGVSPLAQGYWQYRGVEITPAGGVVNASSCTLNFAAQARPDDVVTGSNGATIGFCKAQAVAVEDAATAVVTHGWGDLNGDDLDVSATDASGTALELTTDYTVEYAEDTVTLTFAAGYNGGDGNAVGGEIVTVIRDGNTHGDFGAGDATFDRTAMYFERLDTASGQWIPFKPVVSTATFETGTATITLANTLTGTQQTAGYEAVQNGMRIRVSFDTEITAMTEVASLTSLGTTLTNYFVRGNEIIFGGAHPAAFVFRTGKIVNYEVGANVELTDPYKGTFTFTDPNTRPKRTAVVGFKYTYEPAWPSLTSTAQSMQGGTNGTKLSKAQLYDEMNIALGYMNNYPTDYAVVKGAYLDDEKEGFNTVTGAPETINAQYHTLLGNWLLDVAENTRMAFGIMSLKPNTDFTEAGKATYIDRIVSEDLNDPRRAGNILPLIENPWMIQTALPTYFRHPRTGALYLADGDAAFAGFLASLNTNRSPLNKSFPLGAKPHWVPGKNFVKKMSEARVLTWDDLGSTVISDDFTMAAAGSDYERISTPRIVKEVQDAVRRVTMPFLGEGNESDPAKQQAMATAIDAVIQSFTGTKNRKLISGSFKFASTTAQQMRGDLLIKLYLMPIFCTRRIIVPTHVRRPDAQLS